MRCFLRCPHLCLYRIPEPLFPFALASRGVTGRLTRLPWPGVEGLRALLPGSGRASPGSGGAWDSLASLRSPVLAAAAGREGRAGWGGKTGRAEEVEPEAFPVPVSVRGAAAAAAGAEMPKGGEGRARVAGGPSGAARVRLPLSTQPAGLSASGAERGRPRRLRARPGPRRPIVPLGKLRTVGASSHSLGGPRELGGSGSSPTRKADLERSSPGLGRSGGPPAFRLAGD